MAGEDFVHVRLTEAGRKFAAQGESEPGAGTLRIVSGSVVHEFHQDETKRVLRALDWEKVLAKVMSPADEPMFEEAQD